MRNKATEAIPYRFALKTMPPHSAKQALAPARLLERLRETAEQPLVVVTSLAGFGKTSLLVQWRRELLATGAAVAWLTVDASDDSATFIPALVASIRVAVGLDVPARSFDQLGQSGADLWIASEVLVQIHELARPTYVLIDDLHQLSDAHAVEFVYYLIRNAPPNFHVVATSRADPPFPVEELNAHGLYTQFVTEDLRLRLDDTIGFLRRRLGEDIDIETCARLHERTEGWPMALQIVTAAMARKSDIAGTVAGLSGATGDIARYFSQFVLESLEPDAVAMLVRASILKTQHPELCAALSGVADSGEILSRLEQNTGLVTSVGGDGDNYRMHPLFIEYLHSLLDALPAEELRVLHATAAEWFAAHNMLEQAADHAFVAGMRTQAMDWIEKRLRHLGVQGRIVEVLAWLDRLPPEEITRREGIQLTAAWACALCYRPQDAERLADVILARPGVTPEIALQANIVRSAVAIHCDDYTRARGCIESYDPELGPLYCNTLSFVAIHTGFPDRARYYQQISDGRGRGVRNFYDAMYGAFAVGLSYLIEGQASEAAGVFRAALERAEASTGWRSLPAAVQAAGLAAACWELGAEDEARALLANRLDLIEQAALPDAVMLAYLTLARYENQKGREGKAFDALNSLAAIGELRGQPRLVVASLGEQLRQHAIRNRIVSCRMLLGAIDEIVAGADRPDHGLEAELRLVREIAATRVALLDFNDEGAVLALERAGGIAARLRRGRDQLTVKLLAACCEGSGDDAAARLFAEALSLAESFRLVRVIADDWPAALECLPELDRSGLAKGAGITPAFVERAAERCRFGWVPEATGQKTADPKNRPAQLSAREMEILGALSLGRSNKEIAKMLDVGAETIKWHMKNLLAKLNAANRRHAVDRARLLGIIE
ncbi:LuxR C-terminal-related transcriptional regulator [Aromatoleum aromaticum]|uniref:LuxR C-terminal-related transcriptional regulator n=1 Tax=Aromatoleum aromaticum TaxID=551760 RepID=UPI0014595A9A|nr:LuxR C-terminal-related transcriptional regulator [Aromatoleum aromaticum]NMG54282.1 LuxR family transcriptional regulator [Aromatoleum aromaticum]